MESEHKNRVYSLILLASAIFSYFAITFGFFPNLGFSISFISFTLLAYYIKKEKTLTTKIFFVITLILSAFLSIRSEGFLTFLNIVGIFYFGSLFALTKKDNSENIFSVIFAPLTLFWISLFIPNEFSLEFNKSLSEEKKKESILNTIIVSLITLAVLAIILPLLSSANPIFEKLLSRMIDLMGLENLKITENIFEWTIRLVFFFALVVFVPKMATFIYRKEKNIFNKQLGFNMLMPKIAVAIVLTVFFITQFQLYFSSPETLRALDYTYSRYTNEVFAQLLMVAVIILALLYFEKEKKKINKKMTLILVLEGIFLAFMAYKSDLEYSNAWGFTYKRLYGFAVATWILGIFTIYLYTFLKNIEKDIFLVKSVIYTGIILILINISNFDYLIYHYRRASTGQGVDLQYLSRLSSDSLSFKEQLDSIVGNSSDSISDFEKTQAASKGLFILLYKVERLQEKYRSPDIRGFNLFEYLQYKEVKNIDTQVLRDKYKVPNPV